MSITRYELKDGSPRWRVKYYEGTKQRYATFAKYNDAQSFQATHRHNKRQGIASSDTLAGHFDEVWRIKWEGELSPNTVPMYLSYWNNRIKPELGSRTLTELWEQPQLIDEWAARMRREGVGKHAQRKSIAILSTLMRVAVRWRKIPSNPCEGLERPSGKRQRKVQVLTPLQVETLCAELAEWEGRLVRHMAYCGLRPSEATVLEGSDDFGTHLVIDKAGKLRDGTIGSLKNSDTVHRRSVSVSPAVRELLGEPRLGRLYPPPNRATDAWTMTEWTLFAKRLQRVAANTGVPLLRPYDLRHTFVSLLFLQGENVARIAEQAGHTPGVCLSTYAHVFKDFEGMPRRSMDELIREARAELRGHRRGSPA